MPKTANPSWEEAMNGPEREGYWEAMEVELDTLETKKDSWEEVDRKPWMNVLPSTWAFKWKQFSDGSIRKLKALFCVRGDRQVEGVNYFDTYAPVVNCQTVRLMLVLSAILGHATKELGSGLGLGFVIKKIFFVEGRNKKCGIAVSHRSWGWATIICCVQVPVRCPLPSWLSILCVTMSKSVIPAFHIKFYKSKYFTRFSMTCTGYSRSMKIHASCPVVLLYQLHHFDHGICHKDCTIFTW